MGSWSASGPSSSGARPGGRGAPPPAGRGASAPRRPAAPRAPPRPAGTRPFRVLAVGTGSGAVVVALARTLGRAGYGEAVRFTASDRSQDALALAVENAVSHGVADLIDFRVADLLDPAIEVDGPFDLVVANLPYIPSAVLPELPVAASFEPREALDGGPDGLDLVRRLLVDLPRVLVAGGGALLEIGADQGETAGAAAGGRLPGGRGRGRPPARAPGTWTGRSSATTCASARGRGSRSARPSPGA